MRTKLVAIYYNEGKLNNVDVTLSSLKDHHNQNKGCLNQKDTRMMDNIVYHRMSINSNGRIRFTQMKLWNNDGVIIIFYTFGQHSSKGPVELDVSLVRSFHDIRESLFQTRA